MRPLIAILLLSLVLAGCGSRAALTLADDGGPAPPVIEQGAIIEEPPEPKEPCPACPTAPKLAAVCPVDGQVCNYSPGGEGGRSCMSSWRCEEHRWLEIAQCVSAAACPATAPADGSACPLKQKGLDCFYTRACCSADAIVQCDGGKWRHLNGCPQRAFQDTCPLTPTLEDTVAASHPQKQLTSPALAVAGTQLLLALEATAGMTASHGIYLDVVQTAAGRPEVFAPPAEKPAAGRDSISAPVLAWAGDRFLLAWAANDGWPVTTTQKPGVFLRSVLLEGQGSTEAEVAGAGSPTALLSTPSGRYLSYRSTSPGDPTRQAAFLVALDPTGAPLPTSQQVLADEGAKTPWYAQPPPIAFAQLAPWKEGAVVAVPAGANGDFWDNSGLLVHFLAGQRAEPQSSVRLAVGFPGRVSLAALAEGSVVVGYVPHSEPPAGYAYPFKLVKVWPDGRTENLPNIHVLDGKLGRGPLLVAADDRFAVAWSTVTAGGGGAVHVKLIKASGVSNSNASFQVQVPKLQASDGIAFSFAETDRSFHLAWTVNDAAGLSRIHRQRLICASGLSGI